MKTTHTPGPWQVVNDNAYTEIREANSPFRVIVDFEWTEDSRSLAANARLIAAAPDLLSTVRFLLEQFDGPGLHPDQKSAIAAGHAAVWLATNGEEDA